MKLVLAEVKVLLNSYMVQLLETGFLHGEAPLCNWQVLLCHFPALGPIGKIDLVIYEDTETEFR